MHGNIYILYHIISQITIISLLNNKIPANHPNSQQASQSSIPLPNKPFCQANRPAGRTFHHLKSSRVETTALYVYTNNKADTEEHISAIRKTWEIVRGMSAAGRTIQHSEFIGKQEALAFQLQTSDNKLTL